MVFQFETPTDLKLKIVKEKHNQLQKIMEETNLDCWLIFVRETDVNPDPIVDLVIGGDVVWESAFIFTLLNNKLERIAIVGNFDVDAEKRKGIWTRIESHTKGISSKLKHLVEEISPNKICLNYSLDDVTSDGLSHGMYLKLKNILSEQSEKFASASAIIQKLRARKTETEINLVQKACEMTEDINDKVENHLKPGMTEIEIQEIFHRLMDENGVLEAWQRVSCPAVDAGPEKEMGHVGPTEFKTKIGQTLHNDFGIKLNGYCSDIQRMWFFGKPDEIPNELIHAFNTVHGAITAASEFIRPGVKGFEVDEVARQHVLSAGYEEYKHALGHQVGRNAHDGGTILGPLWEKYGNVPKGVVEEGNIFTLELYVRTKNFGMVSLEEDILVTENGCKFLVPRQEDWRCIY